MNELRQIIERAWNERAYLQEENTRKAVREVIALLDAGELRVAEPLEETGWTTHEWIKKAVLMYFPIQEMQTIEVGPFEFHDKIPLKNGFAAKGVRVVPQALARYGSFIEKGAILMPSYVNIGAWVGSGTMVDTWATVGSCAQIGRNVHLAGVPHVHKAEHPAPWAELLRALDQAALQDSAS